MPLRIAVITTSPGQGSTTYATGLAWSAAADRTVRLIDADPAVGTVRTLLDLDAPASIENVLGAAAVQTAALEAQSVAVERRPNLRVVPGFRRWEFRSAQVITRLGPALAQLPDEVVIVDLGCPFEPSDGGAAPATALLGTHVDAVLVVVRAQADLVERAIRLLDGAPLTRARLVVCRSGHRREMDRTLALLREHLPAYPEPLEWEWDHGRVLSHDLRGEPLHRAGMLEETGLLGEGRIVPIGPRRRGWSRLVPRRSEP